jgi:pimeloyl-ACP methyl ester carboxylesterase
MLNGRSRLYPIVYLTALALSYTSALADPAPKPLGKLVDLGGHQLHVHCSGHGSPIVVVENGLGDFSFDWVLVQSRAEMFTRICTYDRAGYAWSTPGPLPRSFDQINLELRDALRKLGEKGPYVLVGHSYGGPVMRNFALTYPKDTAGLVLVDAAFEGMRVQVGASKTIRLGDGAQLRDIPAPHEQMQASDKPPAHRPGPVESTLEPLYAALPPADRKLQLWAQQQQAIQDAEDSQREWSGQFFARQLAHPQTGSLDGLPLIVLTRSSGGYDGDLDVPAAQLEQERKDGQAALARLSSNSIQIFLNCGHNMDLEDPSGVTAAIRRIVEAVRDNKRL